MTIYGREIIHTLWSNDTYDLLDRAEDEKSIRECDSEEELSDEALYDEIIEANDIDFEDLRLKLDIVLSRPIIILGDIGRWDGRCHGYKMVDCGNVKDCFRFETDEMTWGIDCNGDLVAKGTDHDGTSFYRYRAFKESCSDDDIEDFQDILYYGKCTEGDIEKYTVRLGDAIAKIYGFQIPKEVELQ